MRGGVSVGRVEGDLTCVRRAVINRVGCGDMGHDDRTFAETCQVFARGESPGDETCPCGEGERGER